MSTIFRRSRLRAFAVGALATGIAGLASAQTATPPDQDATFRAHAHTADHHAQQGLPGGMVMLHRPDDGDDRSNRTRTPIKHVILLIGENRTFDHVYATYTPPRGQQVRNLLSEGIVNADGTPGPQVAKAQQWQAQSTGKFALAPQHTAPYATLPAMK